MTDTMLAQAQRLVDALTPVEQVRLLAYLTARIAQAVTAAQPSGTVPPPGGDAWQELFRIGDALAAEDTPESETLTAAVLNMCR